jgi:phosphohistidine phosphatase
MKRLTLVRHGKAEEAVSGQEDWHRPLAPKGHRQAKRMGDRLEDRELIPDLILSSPAARAIATAKLIARVLGYSEKKIQEDDRLYLASPKKILEVLWEVDKQVKHVMVFGHNPGITDCADKLSSERPIDAMPTCAVVTARFAIKHWDELAWATGVDVDLDYPDKT